MGATAVDLRVPGEAGGVMLNCIDGVGVGGGVGGVSGSKSREICLSPSSYDKQSMVTARSGVVRSMLVQTFANHMPHLNVHVCARARSTTTTYSDYHGKMIECRVSG